MNNNTLRENIDWTVIAACSEISAIQQQKKLETIQDIDEKELRQVIDDRKNLLQKQIEEMTVSEVLSEYWKSINTLVSGTKLQLPCQFNVVVKAFRSALIDAALDEVHSRINAWIVNVWIIS